MEAELEATDKVKLLVRVVEQFLGSTGRLVVRVQKAASAKVLCDYLNAKFTDMNIKYDPKEFYDAQVFVAADSVKIDDERVFADTLVYFNTEQPPTTDDVATTRKLMLFVDASQSLSENVMIQRYTKQIA